MIFYFSATGNSLATARQLASRLDKQTLSIPDMLKAGQHEIKLAPAESVGLVLPVYFYTIPLLVQRWIKDLRLLSGQEPYVYAVFTCGGQTGQAGKILADLLRQRNIRLDYSASLIMPDNYILYYAPPTIERQQQILTKAKQELVSIADQIEQKLRGDYDQHKSFFAPLLSTFAAPLYKNGRPTKAFYADQSCTGCGLCVSICPEEIISLDKANGPVWQKSSCTHCLACLHHCPENALQYGKRTSQKDRYLHPEVQFSKN